MRLKSMEMENVGPFDRAEIEFLADAEVLPRVTLLTGVNGTGKTIVLDAIRKRMGGHVERDIQRTKNPLIVLNGFEGAFKRSKQEVTEYWNAEMASGRDVIPAMARIKYSSYKDNNLSGNIKKEDIVQWICHFDYLRDSRSPGEKESGEAAYSVMERIISYSLLDGRLVEVQRSTLTPMVEQSGYVVPLYNVSSGNAYLIQRMINLLGQMFAIHMVNGTDPATLCHTPGLLLIDEAENHLHPQWQKRFLPMILDIFPNLQIIATTHSPFLLTSVPGARVYVCRYEKDRRTCTITEETEAFANLPVDDVLLSPAFDATQPFGEEMTLLLEKRKAAIRSGNQSERARIEAELLDRNPEYFAFLRADERLKEVLEKGS